MKHTFLIFIILLISVPVILCMQDAYHRIQIKNIIHTKTSVTESYYAYSPEGDCAFASFTTEGLHANKYTYFYTPANRDAFPSNAIPSYMTEKHGNAHVMFASLRHLFALQEQRKNSTK